jgi:hypothetical protein
MRSGRPIKLEAINRWSSEKLDCPNEPIARLTKLAPTSDEHSGRGV